MATRFSRDLKVPMEDGERLARGETLAELLGRHRVTQEAEDGRRKEWNGVHKAELIEIQDLAAELHAGTHDMPVECEGFINPEGHYVVRRMDTGVVIETRSATDEDRQSDLGLDPPAET